jgi:hypothetical protein
VATAEASERTEGRTRRRRGPEFTERDAAALTWLGEQYGATLDVLGVLLGRLGGAPGPLSKWGVRNQVQRWQTAGLVTAERVLGDMWVTPTRKGLDRLGLALPAWSIPASRVRHCHAVNVVRLNYEAGRAAQMSPWVSERLTYRERGTAKWHVPDAVVRDPRENPDGAQRYIAVEVELTHKGRRAYAEEVFGNLRAGIAAVSYFVPDDEFAERLRRDIRTVLDQRGSSIRYSVELLPTVPGVSYRGR